MVNVFSIGCYFDPRSFCPNSAEGYGNNCLALPFYFFLRKQHSHIIFLWVSSHFNWKNLSTDSARSLLYLEEKATSMGAKLFKSGSKFRFCVCVQIEKYLLITSQNLLT